MRRLLMGLTTLGIAALPSSAAATQGNGEGLSIVKPDQLELRYDDGKTDAASVWVRNATSAPLDVVFVADTENRDGEATTLTTESSPNAISPYGLQRFELTVVGITDTVGAVPDSGRFTGELVVTGAASDTMPSSSKPTAAPGSIDLELGPTRNITSLVNQLLWIPCAVAFGLALARYLSLRLSGRLTRGNRLGAVNFDFSKSFASTITVVGALLGTVLSASVLPEETRLLTKAEYTTLSLVFGALVVVAGIVFAASERPAEGEELKADVDLKYEGGVGAFFVSAGFTLWAAAGQVACLALIIVESEEAGRMPVAASVIFAILLAIAAGAIVVYTWKRMRWVIENRANVMLQDAQGKTVEQKTAPWPLL
jgi:hypothetical protein